MLEHVDIKRLCICRQQYERRATLSLDYVYQVDITANTCFCLTTQHRPGLLGACCSSRTTLAFHLHSIGLVCLEHAAQGELQLPCLYTA